MRFMVGLLTAITGLRFWWTQRGSPRATGFAVAAIAGAVLALSQILTVVPAGYIGVVDLFGRVSPDVLRPGLRLVNPLARVVPMSVMTQQAKESLDVPSAEGLAMQVEASLVWTTSRC